MTLSDRIFRILGQGFPAEKIEDRLGEDAVAIFETEIGELSKRARLMKSVDTFRLIDEIRDYEFADVLVYTWLRNLLMERREPLSELREAIQTMVPNPEPMVALVRFMEVNQLFFSADSVVSQLLKMLSDTTFSASVRDRLIFSSILRGLGWNMYREGTFAEAQSVFSQSLEIAKEECFMRCLSAFGLGAALWRAGMADEGLEVLSDPELSKECTEAKQLAQLLNLRISIARTAIVAAKYHTARHELKKAETLLAEHDQPAAYEAEYYHVRGLLAFHEHGRHGIAEEDTKRALAMFKEMGNHWGMIDCKTTLSEIRLTRGFTPALLKIDLGLQERSANEHHCKGLIPRLELLREKV